jgi:Recombination endonuclease VII
MLLRRGGDKAMAQSLFRPGPFLFRGDMTTNYEGVKRWRAKNRDKVAAQARRRLQRKREHLKEQQRRWRLANIDSVRQKGAENARKRRAADPEAQRERTRRFRAKQLANQERVAGRSKPDKCELCGGAEFRIVFDHCHATEEFRGWICDRCNRVLGLVKDDPVLLRNMAEYLEVIRGEVDDKEAQCAPGKRVCFEGETLSA